MKKSNSKVANWFVTFIAALTFSTLSACNSGSQGNSGDSGSLNNPVATSSLGVFVRFLGFGDTVSFVVTATNNTTGTNYTSDTVTSATGSSVPASGTATINTVPYGNYNFTINIYDSSSALIVSQEYDNSGAGYDIFENAYDVAFSINLGTGDSLTGTVSSYTSTVSVTASLDFPPTPDLDVNDISLEADFDTAADYVTATFGDNALAFYDYEDAASTTPIDLCESLNSNAISLSFKVQTADASSQCNLDSSDVSINYYNGTDYASSTCGTSGAPDCCHFEITLNESALSSCSAGTDFNDYRYFQITTTGADTNSNSASAVINVDINP